MQLFMVQINKELEKYEHKDLPQSFVVFEQWSLSLPLPSMSL